MMVRYECRVECPYDFELFAKAAGINILMDATVVPPPPDADELHIMICRASPDIKFNSSKTLNELLKIANDLPDLHVLFQTLELEENYTGERKWQREI